MPFIYGFKELLRRMIVLYPCLLRLISRNILIFGSTRGGVRSYGEEGGSSGDTFGEDLIMSVGAAETSTESS